MSASEEAQPPSTNSDPNDQSLKFAVAVSLLRSKLLQSQSDPSESDALRWKRKAKERKQELLRLREDLKEAEDASQCDLFPQSASCKCYFFDNLGKLSSTGLGDGSDRRFNDVIRRRFLRQVRFKERRRREGVSIQRRHSSDLNTEVEIEQLRASVDFLVELCDTASPVGEANFANWAHQAVDFILASLKNLLSTERNMELIEGTVSSLIMHLVRRMCSPLKLDESLHTDSDAQFYVQHLIRNLGSEAYIGQRAILSLSERISVLAKSLLFLDPFDDSFPNTHGCMFKLIQLIEFLISDYLQMWSRDEGFDKSMYYSCCISLLTWYIYPTTLAFFSRPARLSEIDL